jgi:hypothetical protein
MSQSGTEPTGRQLLVVPDAWPLLQQWRARTQFVRRRFVLHDRLAQKGQTVFVAHSFAPDRLSALVERRSAFDQTYARPIRPLRDSELDDKTLDAVAHDVMPQFNLRNIGRYEWPVDLDDPLPWQTTPTIGAEPGRELLEVRTARLPRPQPVQIWTSAYMARLRAQLRRLVVEDPWEAKYGPEATSVHDGPGRKYIVAGTHADDLPGADFGPDLIGRPAQWLAPTDGQPRMERPYDPVWQMGTSLEDQEDR